MVGDMTRGERLQIMLTREEIAALDNWRFVRRMPSRAAAIRELLKRGLAAEGIEIPNDRAKSREFGVIDGPKAQKQPKAAEVLNGIGRAVVLLRRGGLDRLRRAPHNRRRKTWHDFRLRRGFPRWRNG